MQIKLKYRKEYMQGGFGGSSPSAPPPPKPPLPAAAATGVQYNNIDARKPQGAGSTILTSGLGVTNQTSKKTILGG